MVAGVIAITTGTSLDHRYQNLGPGSLFPAPGFSRLYSLLIRAVGADDFNHILTRTSVNGLIFMYI